MPYNWKTYKLSELTELITKGTTPSTYGFGFTDDGINFIKSESTNYDGRLDESSFVKVSIEAYEKLKRSQLKENDILFSMAGAYLGKTGIVCKNHLPANTNQANGIIRVNQAKAIPKFVALALRNPLLVNYVNASGGQSAQPNINLTDIGNLEIALPPIQEQKSIASILSTIDDKIENNLAINKTLEEMAMALYKHWFVDFGPFKDGEFVESELGRIPKGWKTGCLKDILKFKKNNIQPSDATKIMPYVPIDCIKSKKLLLDEFKSGEEAKSSLIKFDKGDIIFGAMRVYFHKVCIAPFEGTSRSTAFVFNTHNDFQYSYGLCLLNDENTISFAASNSQGSTIPYAKWDKVLSDMKIIIPPDIELTNFHEIINEYFNKIIEIFHKNQTLNQLRDTLLPKLIIGEVRLKEFREESITN